MQKQIEELECRITELEEINAGLMVERERMYQAAQKYLEAGKFVERQLRQKIALLTTERDEWKDKAIELSHIATYAAEQGNRKEPRLVEQPADGPVPEMFTKNERSK